MKINIKPQTVITMVGPSHSGKSVQSYVIKAYLESINKTCKIISSDELRREMLHLERSAHIPTSEGFAISELVFKKIKTEMIYYMSYPCNTDVIIVDTTGMDKSFREGICSLAKEYQYASIAIIFQLSKSLLHSRIYGDSEQVSYKKFYIDKQLTRLKEKVLNSFNRHDYISVHRIDDKHIDLSYSYEDATNVLNISSGFHAIYGDVHQQIKELKALYANVESKGCTNHLLVGDYIDKDDESSLLETLDFIYNKCVEGKMKLIKANHEDYVYKHLKDPNYVYIENDETVHFTSLKYFMDPKNEVFKKIFFELYEKYTYDYSVIKNERMYAYITHSPCEHKYLGKHSPKSLKMMRNTRFFKLDESGKKTPAIMLIKDILDQSASNMPLQIFGHVSVGNKFHTYKNIIALDTACNKGGHLTALLLDVDLNKKQFVYEKSTKEQTEEIYDFSYHIKQWSNSVQLTPEQEKRLRRIISANPAFISGTISPSASSNKNGLSLESVNTAVELFKGRGITEVYAQKKHMGSRCQIYLYKEREKCYATSRNGFKIKHADIDQIIDKEYELYKDKYDNLLILDYELLPWRCLGAGLIDNSFLPYYQAVNEDFVALKNSGLKDFVGYSNESFENLEKFNKQAEIYGINEDSKVEIFGVIYKDGKELLSANQVDVLTEFNIAFEVFDLNKDEDVEKLNRYYEDTIADGITEGIVIKPVQWKKGDVPCVKVRNSEYLRIVYGFDYTSNLEKLVSEKSIGSKLSLSIKEHDLNLDLLDAFSKNDTTTQREIYSSLIVEFEKESNLDHRL